MFYLLQYVVVDDFVVRRQPFRAEHLMLAERAHREGRLVLAGALVPPDEAVLVFKGDSPAVAEEFVSADPYVKNGLVRAWTVREWTVVVGG